eukprot:c25348_g1_i3 orf=187-858(+)
MVLECFLSDAAASSIPPRQHGSELLKHYYVAVDRQQFKMGTLVDLLEVLRRKNGLPLIICCDSRDSLDDVCGRVLTSPNMTVNFLHSDLSEVETTSRLENFRKAATNWNQCLDNKLEMDSVGIIEVPHTHVLVVTDACLPSQSFGEAPLSARVVINFDLPFKKETYQRRLISCLGLTAGGVQMLAGGIAINMVVGGEVALLRNIEEGCSIIIDEMPIHIFELL